MNRFLGALLFGGAVVVALGACDDSSSGGYGYGGGGGGNGDPCNANTTCDTCTPVQGCGWCFNATGGLCASGPDECSSASEFTWTWNQSGCPDVDASVAPLDAGTTPVEASSPASDGGTTTTADSGASPVEASAGD
jgi:hypothetical protein